ncbi:hypothetical protein OKS_04494 [Enterococcus faecium EnGen0047]|nr:hypothetical protein OKS_04494 [Enterococcus faecium EnGen0047]
MPVSFVDIGATRNKKPKKLLLEHCISEVVTSRLSQPFPTISQVKGARKIARKRKRQNQGTLNKAPFVKNFRSGQRSGIL